MMKIILVLIFFSILVAGGFLIAFIYNVRSGQYDDTETPKYRMLHDDSNSEKKKKKG